MLPDSDLYQSKLEAVNDENSEFHALFGGVGSLSSSEADYDIESSARNSQQEVVDFCHGSYEEVGKSLAVLEAVADWKENYRLAGEAKPVVDKDQVPFIIKNCLDLYTLVKASDGRRPTD